MTDDPMHPDESAEPHALGTCGARRRDGAPCSNAPMRGSLRCRMHGGAAPQVRAAASRRLATAEWARSFGEPAPDADPVEVVLGEIRWAAGHVAWLRQRVADTDPGDLLATGWLPLYGTERDRLVRQCEIASRMGIAERQIELAERVGQLIADVLRDVLEELHLTNDQQQAAAVAVPRHLRALTGELTGEVA